jgi:hypothetical protein
MGSTATITDSTFAGNQAVAGDGGTGVGFGRGGGIANLFSVMTVENSQILDNVARGGSGLTRPAPRVGFASGGGIFSADSTTLFLTGSVVRGNQTLGGSNNTSTSGNGYVGTALGGGMTNVGIATVTDSLFEDNEARGGNSNRGDGVGHQFVGTGVGGAIGTTAGDPTGDPTRLTLQNVTIRHNRAVGGDGNTAGTFVNAGIGGGLASNGSNNNAPLSSGTTTTILDCTVVYNQAIGGRGGAALGGGVANQLGAVTIVSGGATSHNQARGGEGGDGIGGGIYNGLASDHPSNPGAATILMVLGGRLTHNAALGGAGAGNGLGGGLYLAGTTSIIDASIDRNRAIGGDGAGEGDGGNGFGGGVYNDATSSLQLEHCSVTENHANGGDGDDGGSDGEGIGGGVYNVGLLEFDEFTLILQNHASTSDDDVG